MSDVTAEPTIPKHPFDDADADIIIRSSDGVDFRVYKVVLSKASPVFKDMFTLPAEKPAQISQLSIPVVSVTEDSRTLENLLRMCYPVAQPVLTRLEDVHAVLDAAKKYMMDQLVQGLKDALMAFATKEPFRVLCVAYSFRFEDETRLAAKGTLQLFMRPLLPKPTELCLIPSTVLYNLMQYHDRCTEAALGVFTDLGWVLTDKRGRRILKRNRLQLEPSSAWIWFWCRECTPYPHDIPVVLREMRETFTCRSWWMDYVQRVKDQVAARPIGSLALDMESMQPSVCRAGSCTECGPKSFQQLLEFSKHLAKRIDSATAAVKLDIQW
ncbi:hypothetical protein SCP_0303380 [Sparassis crispa]|uniref:BTB domain-containing protein n=1 Tax=Sparassis crispa TaxID=139825 RepID=A0A401GEU4_9APHY|nr:hypothetical protein SCP_0303380 [Sparassis crispa]GBE80623.1 hypothetical protein SCP_0303380 [Sparassis crispa]